MRMKLPTWWPTYLSRVFVQRRVSERRKSSKNDVPTGVNTNLRGAASAINKAPLRVPYGFRRSTSFGLRPRLLLIREDSGSLAVHHLFLLWIIKFKRGNKKKKRRQSTYSAALSLHCLFFPTLNTIDFGGEYHIWYWNGRVGGASWDWSRFLLCCCCCLVLYSTTPLKNSCPPLILFRYGWPRFSAGQQKQPLGHHQFPPFSYFFFVRFLFFSPSLCLKRLNLNGERRRFLLVVWHTAGSPRR